MMRRREFVGAVAVGTAGLVTAWPRPADAEPPPETTTLRFAQTSAICLAPQYVAGELLKAEGFADVQYVKVGPGQSLNKAVGSGKADLTMTDVPAFVIEVDAEPLPVVTLMGVHAGCYQLFGADRIKSIRDLKGKTVSVHNLGSGRHAFVGSMAAYVGLDPRTDITWVVHRPAESIRLLGEGKIDAYMAFPPDTQELRAKKIGHVLVDIGVDRPWSQYFCCIVVGNRDFVRKNPVATKRALRALLKANDICALEPERVGRSLVDRGFTERYDYAVQTLKEIPYAKWRQYSPEDTMRFYALRFQESGFTKSAPQKVLTQHTDWRFLNELKKELKG